MANMKINSEYYTEEDLRRYKVMQAQFLRYRQLPNHEHQTAILDLFEQFVESIGLREASFYPMWMLNATYNIAGSFGLGAGAGGILKAIWNAYLENCKTVKDLPLPDSSILIDLWSKEELADRLYPGKTYDIAIPQTFVTGVARACNIRHSQVDAFVWLYPKGIHSGVPGPLTKQARTILQQYGQGFLDYIVR